MEAATNASVVALHFDDEPLEQTGARRVLCRVRAGNVNGKSCVISISMYLSIRYTQEHGALPSGTQLGDLMEHIRQEAWDTMQATKERTKKKVNSRHKAKKKHARKEKLHCSPGLSVVSADKGNTAQSAQSCSGSAEEKSTDSEKETAEGGVDLTGNAGAAPTEEDWEGEQPMRGGQSPGGASAPAPSDEVTVVLPPMPKHWLPSSILVFCTFGRVSDSEDVEFSQQASSGPTGRKRKNSNGTVDSDADSESYGVAETEVCDYTSPREAHGSGSLSKAALRLMKGAGEPSSRRELKNNQREDEAHARTAAAAARSRERDDKVMDMLSLSADQTARSEMIACVKTMSCAAVKRSELEKVRSEIEMQEKEIEFLQKYDTADAVSAAVAKLRILLQARHSPETPALPTAVLTGGDGAAGYTGGGAGVDSSDGVGVADSDDGDSAGAVGDKDNDGGHDADGAYMVGDDDDIVDIL